MWLKADGQVITSGSSVTQWNDASGNNVNALTAPGHTNPTLSVAPELNNMPTIKFNGSTDGLASTVNIRGDSSLTVFVVAKGYNQNTSYAGMASIGTYPNGLWLCRTSNNYMAINSSNGISTVTCLPLAGFPYTLLGYQKNIGVSDNLDTNSLAAPADHSALVNAFPNSPAYVGYCPGFSTLNGDIAEVIIYTTNLSDARRHQVENYLYNKYAPPVDLGPDQVETYSFCPKTLDAGSRFIAFNWSTGATTQTILASQSGTYSVTATDVFNRSSSSSVHITLPGVTLNIPDTSFCMGYSIAARPVLQAPLSAYTFIWSNNATTSTINISAPGSYSVIVSDTTLNHCSLTSNTIAVVTDTFATTVSLGPDDSLCSGNTLGLTSPGPSTWGSLLFHWSTGATTSTIILGPGDQQYLVTVTNSGGCIGTASKHIHILGVAPTLSFSGDTFCLGQTYDPHNTTDPTNIVSYNWDFGDGGTGVIYDPTHVYVAAGIQNVTLTIANNAGCSNNLTRQVYVKQNPAAAFNTGQACIANSYQFIDLSTPPAGGSLISWNWNFGDGNTSTLQYPANTYSSTGNYTVTLTDSASNGCASTVTGIIQVVSSSTLPPAAILEIPLNNSVVDTTLVTFSWDASAGASDYSVIVSPDPTFSSNVSYFNSIDSTQFVTTLPANQVYYWKVVAYNICGQANISQPFTFTIFNPGNLGGLVLWLKGDGGHINNGGSVSQWTDMSPSGVNAIQNTAASQPQLVNENLMNFKPVMKFDGVDDGLQSIDTIPNITNSSTSVFIIGNGFAQSAGTTAAYLNVGTWEHGLWMVRNLSPSAPDFVVFNNWTGYNNTFKYVGAAPLSGYPFKMFEFLKDYQVADTGFVNGAFKGNYTPAATCGSITNAPYTTGIALEGGYTLNGEIAEIIVYNTKLNPTQRQLVENYIYNKYAPPVNLGPDIVRTYGACPVVLNAQNRFVQYTWSTGDTTPTITVNKSGTFWVTTIDVFGRESSDTINITLPYHGVTPVDTAICFGQSAQLVQLIDRPYLYHYLWQDGTTNTNPITVNTTGNYYAKIIDTSGCFFISDTAKVRVDSFNIITLLPADTTICNNSGLSLNAGGYQISSYLWSPGNYTTASPPITSSGIYYVTAVDINGCASHDSANVHTHASAPLTDFTITNSCSNDSIIFTDQSQPANNDLINAWNWNFGDTSVGTGTPVKHLYATAGQFAVTLFITTDSGCTGAKTINKTINPSPNPAFIYVGSNPAIPYAICAGNYTVFTDVTPFTVPVISRTWIIDGAINSATQSQFQYRLPNQQNDVSLTVTTDSGCSSTSTQEIDVFPALAANFTYSGACLGETTVFTDITHSLSIISWEWQFGDSIIGLQQNETHNYPVPGSYDVTLTVENAIGCIDHQTQLLNIVPPPVANFTDTTACKKQYYSPIDNSTPANTDPITHWTWNIGGSIFNTQAPRYFAGDTGAMQVSLKITTQAGCTDSVSKKVEIEPVPVALFNFTPLYGSAPVDVSFTNNSTGATSYLWNFGDGTSSIQDTLTHTYTVNGDYNIVLYAQNNYGCADSLAKVFVVVQTDLDISVDAVSSYNSVQPDGSVLVSIIVRYTNLGTRIITSSKFYASVGGIGVLEQNWTGVLQSGQLMLDTIGNFVSTAGNPQTYICVTAKDVNNGQTETRYDNNEACVSLDGTLQLVGPSPNPAIGSSILGMILPKAGSVTIDIVDPLGKYVIHQFKLTLPAGRSDFNIPVDMMNASEYFIRVNYNDETQVRKLVIR